MQSSLNRSSSPLQINSAHRATVADSVMSSRFGGLRSNLLISLAALALFVVAAMFLAPKPAPAPLVPGVVAPGTNRKRESTEELSRILNGMDPLRLQISSDPVSFTNDLNGWYAEFGPNGTKPPLAQDEELVTKLLRDETLRRAQLKSFSIEDTNYIRECILARKITAAVTSKLETDAARALALFNFTVRHASLIRDDAAQPLPLTPYETLLFNIGTRDDRIWTFAALLRQLRLDVVVITPQTDGVDENPLVGVMTPRDGILLFDPRLGLPIPGPADDAASPWISQVATLQQVLENDAPLRKLDFSGRPYPVNSNTLKKLRVELVGVASSWAPRMAELQFLLPPDVDVVLHDGLGKSDARSAGQYERVIATGAGGLWQPDQVGIWHYPERALKMIAAAKGVEDKRFTDLLAIFRGPQQHRRPSDPKSEIVPVSRTLQLVRTEQLMGSFSTAIPDYVGIQSAPGSLRNDVNLDAAGYALVWTGECQLERGDVSSAVNTFRRFFTNPSVRDMKALRRWASEGLARCLVQQGQLAEAAAVLEQAPPSYSPRTDAYLIRRWTGKDNVPPANSANAPAANAPTANAPTVPEKESAPAEGEPPPVPMPQSLEN